MEPTLAELDRFEDSKDILSAIKRAFGDAIGYATALGDRERKLTSRRAQRRRRVDEHPL